jgi:hypothetical protein
VQSLWKDPVLSRLSAVFVLGPLRAVGSGLLVVGGFLGRLGRESGETVVDEIEEHAGKRMIEILREATEEQPIEMEITARVKLRIVQPEGKQRP